MGFLRREGAALLEVRAEPPLVGGLLWYSSQFKNNYFTEMCSGSETGSYLRLIDFVYHSTLGLRVIKKKKGCCAVRAQGAWCRVQGSGCRVESAGLKVQG